MSRSNVSFERWSHIQVHSWPFNVYKQYNEELSTHLWTEEIISIQFEKEIKKINGNDIIRNHYTIPSHVWNMKSIDEIKEANKERRNWNRLNVLMAASSNFETFLESIISLAIESNPGVLLGCPKSIDGAKLLKKAHLKKEVYANNLRDCVEGEWIKRINSFKKLFGGCPSILSSSEGELDNIRKLRNKVGHAFGRDIDSARDFTRVDKLPSDRLSMERLKKWMKLYYDVATSIDLYLLDNHVGEYQAILAFHKNSPKWTSLTEPEKVKVFKKMYGATDQLIGKKFSKELISYYSNL